MKTSYTRKLVAAAVFAALIVVMTVVPYTGYINYGLIEITTLHIPVILGAVMLGAKYGALLGGIWGITCFVRAFTNPLWIIFTNPLVSVVPRIVVGMVAGLVFALLARKIKSRAVCAVIAAVCATLTNTLLVLGAIYAFGGMIESYAAFFELFKTVFTTIISLNGIIELVAAIVLVPVLQNALERTFSTTEKQS